MKKRTEKFSIGCESPGCREYLDLIIRPAPGVKITGEHVEKILEEGYGAIDTKHGVEDYWLETNKSKCINGEKHNFSVIKPR